MDDTNLTAGAVASAAHGVPPSFLGMDWLLAVNLWVFSAGFLIAALICAEEVVAIRCNRREEPWTSPASIWRLVLALASGGFAVRLLADALTLWTYTPGPVALVPTIIQVVQRFLDPLGAAVMLGALVLAKLARPAIIAQLRKQPLPIDRWEDAETRRLYAAIAGLCLVLAAFGSFFR